MAYSKSARYTLPVNADNTINVPAVEQEAEYLGYNDEVEVTLYDEVEVTLYPENDAVTSLTFTAYLTSVGRITIPSEVRNRFETSGSVSVSFEGTGKRWGPEVGASARKAVYESAHPEQQSLEAVTDIISADD